MDEAIPSPLANHRMKAERSDPDPITDGQSSGSQRADFWIKIVQRLGFPIMVAGACLWIGNGLINDYRENLKANSEAARVNAEANHSNAESNMRQAELMDRINESQTTTHVKIDEMKSWQRRAVEEQIKTNQLLQNSRIKVSNGPETAGATPDPMH